MFSIRSYLVANYAKIVDERGRNPMCNRLLQSLMFILFLNRFRQVYFFFLYNLLCAFVEYEKLSFQCSFLSSSYIFFSTECSSFISQELV